MRVTADGTVRVTMPRWGSKREAAAFAEREHAWIEKQQRRVRSASGSCARTTDAAGSSGRRRSKARAARPAKRELPVRLLELAAQHGLTVTRISIRNQRWRWGSCSRSGHICLNWRLVQMPDAVRDYVLIHELMHLKRMDHSPAFWKLVAAACPDVQRSARLAAKPERALNREPECNRHRSTRSLQPARYRATRDATALEPDDESRPEDPRAEVLRDRG